jgi:hypothetical protein
VKDIKINVVKIEAKFDVAEYQVLILSATEAAGLDQWLKINKYKIPAGAEALLRPYVEAGSKFFVAKVDPQKVQIHTMHVDTATFQPHDIKDVIRYPVTFAEVAPWVAGSLALAGLLALVIWLIIRYRRSHDPEHMKKDPAHIVALRKLDRYRGNKMWAPEKQKAFYSGITDTLREYIAARYRVGAMEMTTAEIFNDMKSTDAPADLLDELRELFERADFVKFAKFTASDEDNASALPVAVRFVTSTYQADVEEAAAQDDKSDEIKEGGK